LSFNGHLTDYLQQHAEASPDKLALVTNDKSLTWLELWQRVQAGSAHLDSLLPSESQQIVAILMPNSWQYVVAYLSIVHAGHMALPIEVIYKPLEIEAVLHQVPAALIITDQTNHSRLPLRSAPVVEVEEFASVAPTSRSAYLRLAADKQIACLLFTSGTTGKPKVVPCSHANHLWNIKVCSQVWNWTDQDSQLVSLRLSHWYGIVMGLAGTLYHGNTMYLMDRFDAEATLTLLASGKISIFSHSPPVYAKLLEVPTSYDLGGVRLFISGSGPLPPAIWEKFKNRFGQEILEVYGSTETGRIASNLLDERLPGSPGRLLPEVKIKFSPQGEVLVKSPGLLPGYFNNPGATAKTLDSSGYCRTGDLGELKDGHLFLRGRTLEKIRKQGYTISPRDIEWALYNDHRIKEALVIGVQRPGESNDELVYFLVGEVDEAEIKEFCQANLPSIWRPDKIVLLPDLPRTRNGKPQLAKLKAMVK